MGAMSPVLGCDLSCASSGTRSGGYGSGKVGVGLPKWGLGYVSLGSLDVDRSTWWCAISPVLGYDELVLVCDLAGARVRRAGVGVLSSWCFRWRELADAGVRSRQC